MENTNQSKAMPAPELLAVLAVWGPAFVGGTLGSIVIGILGVLLTYVSYPNSELEYGAAIVGALCGSFLSIPIVIGVGGVAGIFIYNFLSKRNSQRPALSGGAAAFVISALISAVSLVPIGFFFFGLGHIQVVRKTREGSGY